MTLVVTHANGFLACFTRADDGSMRQRALIDTGDDPPTAVDLANLGDELARTWNWLPALPASTRKPYANAKPAVVPLPPASDPVKRLKDAERKRKDGRGVRSKTDPPPRERPAMVTRFLEANPRSTLAQIIVGLGLKADAARLGRWHHTIVALREAGAIQRSETSNSVNPYVYWVTDGT